MGGVPFWLRKQEFSSHGWLPFLFRKQRSRPKSGRELVFFLRVGGWVGSSSDVLRFRVGACYGLLLLNLLLLLIHPLPSCSSSLAPSPATLLLQFGNSAATSNHSVSTLLLCLCVCLSLCCLLNYLLLGRKDGRYHRQISVPIEMEMVKFYSSLFRVQDC